jgi:hypothetical protein
VFQGGGVALTQWSLWDESADAIGWRYYDGVLCSHGIAGTIREKPAALAGGLRPGWLTVCSLGLLPMVFRWDAWLLSSTNAFLAFISHDGFVDVALKSKLEFARFRNEIVGEGVIAIPRTSPDSGSDPSSRT